MPDWVFQIITAGSLAGGAYAAIRADLARLHERVNQAKAAAEEAHRRLDQLFNHRRA